MFASVVPNDSENNGSSCAADFGPPRYTAYLTFVSCVASLVGSFLIIMTFAIWKEFRTIGRAILVFLAIADFFSALGYMFGVLLILTNPDQSLYRPMCVVQSVITSFFPVSSFIWTLNLAIYLLAVLVKKKNGKAIFKLLVTFHLAAWGIPLIICSLGLGFKEFGPNNSTTSVNWCFISFDSTHTIKFFAFEALCGKFWEILTYFTCLVIYIIVRIKSQEFTDVSTMPQAKYWSMELVHRFTLAANHFESKLMWIPLIFIFIRVWGTIRFLGSMSCDLKCLEQCKTENIALIILQSIFDPAQGWANALLFVIFHRPIAVRICPCVFKLYDKVRSLLFKYTCCKQDDLHSPLLGNNKAEEVNGLDKKSSDCVNES